MDSGIANPAIAFAEAKSVAAKRWLVSPLVDLFFCCGGGVWLAAFAYIWVWRGLPIEWSAKTGVLLLCLTHVFSNPHTSATWVRIYGDSLEEKRFRFYSLWLAIAMLGVGVYALGQKGWPEGLANLYLLWVILHYTSQVYGIALLYCMRWNYRFAPRERTVFKWAMIFTAVYSIARKLAWQEYAVGHFLGMKMPFWGPVPEWIPTVCFGLWAGTGLLFGFIVVDKFFKEGKFLPFPAILLVFSGVMFTLATGPYMSTVWLFVPPFFHGSQYMMVSAVYHFGKKRQDDSSFVASLVSWEGIKYWALLIMIGNFIYTGTPQFLAEIGYSYTAALGVIFSIVNFHHFLTDAAIWKLRDPKTREVLVNG